MARETLRPDPLTQILQEAAYIVRGTGVCEKPHRNGEAHPHIHFDDHYIARGRKLSDIARALRAATPDPAEPDDPVSVRDLYFYEAGIAEGRRIPDPAEPDTRSLTEDERRVCGNCPHVKYDHFMPGSERCEEADCPCPGFLTVTPDPAEPHAEDCASRFVYACSCPACRTPDRAASTVEPGAQWSEHEGDDRTDRGQSDRRDGVAGVSGHRHDAAVPRRDGPADDAGPSLLPAVRDQSEGPVEPVGGSTERLEPGYDFSKAKRGVYFERATGHPDRAASTVEPGLRNRIIVATASVLRDYTPDIGSTDRARMSEAVADRALTPDETA